MNNSEAVLLQCFVQSQPFPKLAGLCTQPCPKLFVSKAFLLLGSLVAGGTGGHTCCFSKQMLELLLLIFGTLHNVGSLLQKLCHGCQAHLLGGSTLQLAQHLFQGCQPEVSSRSAWVFCTKSLAFLTCFVAASSFCSGVGSGSSSSFS